MNSSRDGTSPKTVHDANMRAHDTNAILQIVFVTDIAASRPRLDARALLAALAPPQTCARIKGSLSGGKAQQ